MSVSLTNHNYYILLAVAQEPKHALQIQRQIVADTMGMHVGTSTIYASLKSMERESLIKKLEGYPAEYQINPKGRRYLEIESRSMKLALEQATTRLKL